MNDNFDQFVSSMNENEPAPAVESEAKSDNFDKESWSKQKQAERGHLTEMLGDTTMAVIYDEDTYKQYLDVVSRFDKYSVVNTLLIFAQKPFATKLADADHWKKNEEYIKKGEKGISIWEPGDKYMGTDGTEKTRYNVKKLFDISQTTAKKTAEPTVKYDEKLILKALLKDAPAPTNISETLREGIGASYDHRTKQIYVRPGMDGQNIIRWVSQEIVHAMIAKDLSQNADYNRLRQSFKALTVSYIICKRSGVDTTGFKFGRVNEMFKEMDSEKIRDVLDNIRDLSNEIWGNMLVTLNPPAKSQNPNKTAQAR